MGDGRAPSTTTENDGDVGAFLAAVPRQDRREDADVDLGVLEEILTASYRKVSSGGWPPG